MSEIEKEAKIIAEKHTRECAICGAKPLWNYTQDPEGEAYCLNCDKDLQKISNAVSVGTKITSNFNVVAKFLVGNQAPSKIKSALQALYDIARTQRNERVKFEEKWTREYDGWKEQCLMGARGENCE